MTGLPGWASGQWSQASLTLPGFLNEQSRHLPE
jgi:hypothetical protein